MQIEKIGMSASWGSRIVGLTCDRPKLFLHAAWIITLSIVMLAVLPTLFPSTFSALNPLRIDTDPENMLSADEPVRVFHNEMKRVMGMHDLVLVGVVDETDPDGIFNPETLRDIHELTEFAASLQWPSKQDPTKEEGVISIDMISPANVDVMEPDGDGSIRFDWLMFDPPETRAQAQEMLRKIQRIPMFNGTLIGVDGKSVALYIPVTSKSVSFRVAKELREKIASFGPDQKFYITGMPVAQDAFGVEMFIQMAITAPAAMLVIFALMYFFFRNLTMVSFPMVVAMFSVLCTMGLLVMSGNTVHIMSSMIAIFIMPIAVLDSIHVLSEFFDRYPQTRDRRKTLASVMQDLFKPMMYTSLTTAVAFISLVLTPIPPVQVFGVFVAIGVLLAWISTITLIPACIMCMSEETLLGFGESKRRFFRGHKNEDSGIPETLTERVLGFIGRHVTARSGSIILLSFIAVMVGLAGISKIQVNDNPMRWFTEDHPIREADRVLNEHFGGTYMSYLTFSPSNKIDGAVYSADVRSRLEKILNQGEADAEVLASLIAKLGMVVETPIDETLLFESLERFVRLQTEQAEGSSKAAWKKAYYFFDEERVQRSVFKRTEVLSWIKGLQTHLDDEGVVGKSISVIDIVQSIYRDLQGGDQAFYKIPDSLEGVAQSLFMFQNSHRAHDLWHFVTPDYRRATIWMMMKSGDNIDMANLEAAVARFIERTPPPVALNAEWFGLTYINKAWQEKMVTGMANALMGSFLVVLLMMIVLFRSIVWGLLAMVPLTVTLIIIYGIVGWIGKDYDMPVAILSTLALGLAVDFAIHFLVRMREHYRQTDDMTESIRYVFAGPALAISRNALVVSVGFLPLLAAPLVPYNTVGILIASILILSALSSVLLLPALLIWLQRLMFSEPGLTVVRDT